MRPLLKLVLAVVLGALIVAGAIKFKVYACEGAAHFWLCVLAR